MRTTRSIKSQWMKTSKNYVCQWYWPYSSFSTTYPFVAWKSTCPAYCWRFAKCSNQGRWACVMQHVNAWSKLSTHLTKNTITTYSKSWQARWLGVFKFMCYATPYRSYSSICSQSLWSVIWTRVLMAYRKSSVWNYSARCQTRKRSSKYWQKQVKPRLWARLIHMRYWQNIFHAIRSWNWLSRWSRYADARIGLWNIIVVVILILLFDFQGIG